MNGSVGVAIALTAGLLSFLSPCVLPRRHLSLYRAAEQDREDEPPTPKAPLEPESGRLEGPHRPPGGNRGKGTGWKMANLVRASTTLGSAIAGNRALGREDRTILGTVSFLLIALALFAGFYPAVFGWAVAVIVGWLGIVTGVRAFVQARQARLEERRLQRVNERLDEKSS